MATSRTSGFGDSSAVNGLLERFQRAAIGEFPTPIRPAVSPEGIRFWVKDDGRCSDVYGGNKLRKLEFLLPHVRRLGKRRLVVHGDIESHTVFACCIWGRVSGFEVDAVVFPHRD